MAALRAALRRWYQRERRDLPFRRTRDPWAIWVSETILQQTTIAVIAQERVQNELVLKLIETATGTA